MAGELLDRDHLSPGERVIMSDGEDAGLAGEGRPDHDVGQLQRHPRSHRLDLVLPQSSERVIPRRLHDLDVAVGVKRLEGADDLDEVRPAGGSAEEAEPQRPAEPLRSDV